MYGAVAVPDWIQSTDLIEAVKFNRLEEVSWRLRMGENVNRQLSCGRTALHWATAYNYYDCARILMDYRPTLSIKDNRGNTSLHVAASTASSEVSVAMVQLLVERGADKDAQNNLGRTPLHEATIHGNTEIMKKLLLSGVRKDVRDWEGNTASDWAIRNNNIRLAGIICGGEAAEGGLGLDLISIINNVAGETSAGQNEPFYGQEMGEKSKNATHGNQGASNADGMVTNQQGEGSGESKEAAFGARREENEKRDGACGGARERSSYGIIKMIMDGATSAEKDGNAEKHPIYGGAKLGASNSGAYSGPLEDGIGGGKDANSGMQGNCEKDDGFRPIKEDPSVEEEGVNRCIKDENSGDIEDTKYGDHESGFKIRKYLSGKLTPEEEWKFLIERLAELEMDESRQIKTEKRELKSKLDFKMGLLITKKQRFKQEKADLEAEIGRLVRNLETLKVTEEKETKELEKEIRELSRKLEETKSKSGKSNKQIVNAIKMESILECPVCLDICKPPIQIWQCPEGHIICGRCAARPELVVCPQCRQPVEGKMSRNRALEDLSTHVFPASEHVRVVSPQGPQPRPAASRYVPGMMTPTPPMWEHIWGVMPMYQDYVPGHHASNTLFPNNMESYFRPIHAHTAISTVPTPTIPNPNTLGSVVPTSNSMSTPSSLIPSAPSINALPTIPAIPSIPSIMSTLPPLPAPRVHRGRGRGGRGMGGRFGAEGSMDQITQWMDALSYDEPAPQRSNGMSIGEGTLGFSLLSPFNPTRDASAMQPYNPGRDSTGIQAYNPARDGGGMQPYNPARDSTGMQPYNPSRDATGMPIIRDGTGLQPYNPSRDAPGMQSFNPSRDGSGMQPYNPARDTSGSAASRGQLRSGPSDTGLDSNGFYSWNNQIW